MSAPDSLREADRLMTICNACRYCEGLCAVFPAMELRRAFEPGDLRLLANLCHNCGACYDDCQFAPPHEFAVNVPRALARVRRESWEAYVWPSALAPLLRRSGAAVALGAAASVAVCLAAVALRDPAALFTPRTGPGAFYQVAPHAVLAWLFGAIFLYALVAMGMGLRAFWRDAAGDATPPAPDAPSIRQAIRDAGALRYLDGGGAGCGEAGEARADRRRLFHHLTFYGFLLCFAATGAGTVYHYLLGREAPYAWWEPPVVLGVLGGLGLVVGPLGLVAARRRRPELADPGRGGMDAAFSLLLVLTGLSGLALLAVRASAAMPLALAAHLGLVCAFFLAMPYSRFVHGLYRFAALVRHAQEMRDALGDRPVNSRRPA